MTDFTRRSLMGGAAATTVLATAAAHAQADLVTFSRNLKGKSILITGTSSGFGRLAAESFAEDGATVFATMRNLPRPEADELERVARDKGLDLHVIEIDVNDDAQVAAGVAKAEELAGGAIDVLINNAGISTAGPVEIQDMEATKLLFDTNVFGPQRLMRAVLPKMRAAKSGQIFNVTSQLGRVIVPSYGQYSPTKFALEAMSEQIAYELVPHNIDVTIIEPGGYPTAIWKNSTALSLELLDRADDKHTVGYTMLIEQMRQSAASGGGGSTDPMDVPNAIAEIIKMPPGTRPLRKEVHPGAKPQIAINKASAEAQVGWLGASPYGPWIKAAHNV